MIDKRFARFAVNCFVLKYVTILSTHINKNRPSHIYKKISMLLRLKASGIFEEFCFTEFDNNLITTRNNEFLNGE